MGGTWERFGNRMVLYGNREALVGEGHSWSSVCVRPGNMYLDLITVPLRKHQYPPWICSH